MRAMFRGWSIPFCVAIVAELAAADAAAEVQVVDESGFVIQREVTIAASPGTVYDAFDGDISAWWDHSFSDPPESLYIEARPGGGFYEIFDDEGNGALHATVIYADRGKLLRFVGPLGLSGNALYTVFTLTFEAQGDDTLLRLDVQGAGRVQEGWPRIIDEVWKHFLVERLKPYVESGKNGVRQG